MMIKGEKLQDFKEKFEKVYLDEFGFISEERDLLVEAIRVRTIFRNGDID
jgi:N-methylhydantoinase A/oxoprolinase/acetone carboxylase beta subunit